MTNPIPALQALHQKYNGQIPRAELDAALGRNTAIIEAAGRVAFYERMLQGTKDSKATLEEQKGSYTPEGYASWLQSLEKDIGVYTRELDKARAVAAHHTPAMAAE